MTNSIRLDINGSIGKIVLNNPQRRNALSVQMWQSIPELVTKAELDPDVKVIIIHGGDAGAFAAGADISEFEEIYSSAASAEVAANRIDAALMAIENCKKPTIAAIDGACIGGGVSLAMAADLRIASTDSKFGVTPGKLGLVYPAGDTNRLLRAIGSGATKDLLFTGRILLAPEARSMNLIDRVTTETTALEAAREWADQIGSISQWSARATKQMIHGLLEKGWNSETKEAQELFLKGFNNVDFEDGYKAFLEKRPPNFTFK